jgi:hypothetical protein
MAFEGIVFSATDFIIGVIVLIIGCVIYAFSPQFPRGFDIAGKIIGIIVAVVGAAMVVLAFF